VTGTSENGKTLNGLKKRKKRTVHVLVNTKGGADRIQNIGQRKMCVDVSILASGMHESNMIQHSEQRNGKGDDSIIGNIVESQSV